MSLTNIHRNSRYFRIPHACGGEPCDPRTKKQIAAYREKEKNRRKLLEDIKQWKRYKAELGNKVPGTVEKFRELKYNGGEKWAELKEKFKLTIRENEFRMESKETGMALEYQRYGRNKETLINNAYIDGGEYKRKFDKITANPETNRVLYQKAKEMLKHRSGTLIEDMYWIDADTGKVIASATDERGERSIKYTGAIYKKIAGIKNIIAMHTHPSSMPPSANDFNSFYKHGYKQALIICHDGTIFRYSSNGEIRESLYNIYISKHLKTGSTEFEAQMMALEEFKTNSIIDFEEVI